MSPRPAAAALVAAGLLLACARTPVPPDEAPAVSERAPRMDLVEALEEDLAAARHASDGGGEAWLEAPLPARAAKPGRWTIRYRAGPLGVTVGGTVFLQVSPFWGWSTPQTTQPEAPGYTEVRSDAPGVELMAATLDQQLLGIEIGGRALVAGEELAIDYGAGPAGARADRFAESESALWIAVDGDGDGVRALIAGAPPSLPVVAGPPARVVATLPSTAVPGARVALTLAVLDAAGNAGVDFAGEIALESEPAIAGLPPSVRFAPADGGLARVVFRAPRRGVVRLWARAFGAIFAANPMQTSARGARVLWADLQNHSARSDGTGTPEDVLRYARDVAALDVVAITDHDHWGMRFLDREPAMWREIRAAGARFDRPGRFLVLDGWEWTSWIWGHRHVLLFDCDDADDDGIDDVPLLSTMDPRYDTPQELWAGLRAGGRRALTIAHHSAGGPIAIDWGIAPDPAFEPVTEIVSVHGSSEAADSPQPIYAPVRGNFVRDALARGYRLGFIGSSDGHDGHPGLGHLVSASGGLAAILAETPTREAVYEALIARRTYATSGPRILLRALLGGHRMGAAVPLDDAGRPLPGPVAGVPAGMLTAQVWAPEPLQRIDLVRSGTSAPAVIPAVDCAGALDCSLSLVLDDLEPGEYLYLRAIQQDGHAAWSSPWFME